MPSSISSFTGLPWHLPVGIRAVMLQGPEVGRVTRREGDKTQPAALGNEVTPKLCPSKKS